MYEEATRLLDEVVFPIARTYGKVHVIGSYVYRLLYQPDIDLHIISSELSKEHYLKLAMEIMALPTMSQFKSTDRVSYTSKIKGRPSGYWLCPTLQYGNNEWTVDIWFQKPEWYKDNTQEYLDKLSQLDDEKRNTILALKKELIDAGSYGVGKEFLSVDIYNGVVSHAVSTLADLRAVRQNNGV